MKNFFLVATFIALGWTSIGSTSATSLNNSFITTSTRLQTGAPSSATNIISAITGSVTIPAAVPVQGPVSTTPPSVGPTPVLSQTIIDKLKLIANGNFSARIKAIVSALLVHLNIADGITTPVTQVYGYTGSSSTGTVTTGSVTTGTIVTGNLACTVGTYGPLWNSSYANFGLTVPVTNTIASYRIQWSSGRSPVFTVGSGDVDRKGNCGYDTANRAQSAGHADIPLSCQRRVRSYFADHNYQIVSCNTPAPSSVITTPSIMAIKTTKIIGLVGAVTAEAAANMSGH